MACVLILLLAGLYSGDIVWFKVATPLLFVAMAAPVFFYPFSVFWYGLAEVLGSLSSGLVLTVLYFLLVCPVGILRRIAGKDTLHLKQFGKSNLSVFKDRSKEFTRDDLQNPY